MLFVLSSQNKPRAPANDSPGPSLRFQPLPGCENRARGFASLKAFCKIRLSLSPPRNRFSSSSNTGFKARGEVVHPRFSREPSGISHREAGERAARWSLRGSRHRNPAGTRSFSQNLPPPPPRPSWCRAGSEDRRGDFLRGVVIDHTMCDTGLTNKTI